MQKVPYWLEFHQYRYSNHTVGRINRRMKAESRPSIAMISILFCPRNHLIIYLYIIVQFPPLRTLVLHVPPGDRNTKTAGVYHNIALQFQLVAVVWPSCCSWNYQAGCCDGA